MASDKTILIVDDEPAFARLLCDYLQAMGYATFAATEQRQALELFQKIKPPLVLLDYKMPGLPADEFMSRLQDVSDKVRVIIVSGYTPEEVEGRFRGLGYFSYFIKGQMSLDMLRQEVEQALSG